MFNINAELIYCQVAHYIFPLCFFN